MSYELSIVIVSLMLVFTGVWFGTKFLKARNPLLGYEWYILAFSASNAAIYFATGRELHITIALFCDAFSRTIGIPVIGTLGLMQITHRLTLSNTSKISLFILGAIVAAAIMTSPRLLAMLPYGALIVGMAFFWIMAVMALRLFRIGEVLHGVLMVLFVLLFFLVGISEGIAELPNPHKLTVLDFWFFANVIWALGFAEIYFAYRAIERADERYGTRSIQANSIPS